jgi:phosphoesterase RecJ-like protein
MDHYFPEHSKAFMEAINAIRGRPVALLGHVRPDGDCIGSQVGLARCLRELGFDAVCYNHHEVPQNCRSFVGDTPFFVDEDGVDPSRVAIAVDCADHKRLGPVLQEAFPRGLPEH